LGIHGEDISEGVVDVETSPCVIAVVAEAAATAAAAVGTIAWLCSEVIVALGDGLGLASGLSAGAIPGSGRGVILGVAGMAGLPATGGGDMTGVVDVDV